MILGAKLCLKIAFDATEKLLCTRKDSRANIILLGNGIGIFKTWYELSMMTSDHITG